MEPWDGVWTEELLRDLCGGVTRKTGEVKVSIVVGGWGRKPGREIITVKRTDKWDYSIRGSALVAVAAAVKLNELGAVPVNDNGKMWKVKISDDACPKCQGRKYQECPECDGRGETECCECGQDIECDVCDGVGTTECDCVAAAKLADR